MANKQTKPGELTHIDLWGKYAIFSLQGNQYYIVFVDNAGRWITIDFLKENNQVGKMVKNYLTCLITSGRKLKYIHMDCGKEFLSDQLKEWCKERGIEIQLTAPYSPSQNGVAECINHTLIELACAMIATNKLPEYLWESTVAQAMYLQNQAFTITLNTMPYQIWHKNKPNVAHLREFSALIWILLQGKYIQWKILPKSKQRVFVSYNNSSH